MPAVRTSTGAAPRPTGVVDRVFVYGSLRSGHRGRDLVEPYVRDWEPATVHGELFDFPGGYPGVLLTRSRRLVMGELLWLREPASSLASLDEYEGADYRRELVQVDHIGGPTWAWIYVLADPRAAALGTPVPGGEWRPPAASDPFGQPTT
jgi:gamma-glutamylcyclotransferase (GGCT)/AIG2-like uncharacterized protein YtfP